MVVKSTPEFDEWLGGIGVKLQALVDDRLDRVRQYDHFGSKKSLGEGLLELRWKNGLRVYFGYVIGAKGRAALILLGGDKNGQNRDIKKARSLLARETA